MNEDAVRGIPWTMMTFAVMKVVGAATTIVLARLLAPSDFGLFAMATLGIALLSIFNGNWLGATLIVRSDLDDRARGTVLTMLMLSGFVLAAALAAASPLCALAFGEPRLEGILLVFAALLLFSGINWFYEMVVRRELLFRRRFVVQAARTVTFSGVALTFGFLGAGVWSLVAAQIVSLLVNTVGLMIASPYRVRMAFDRSRALEIMRSSRGFLGQELAEFFQQNADYLSVGQILGATQLGYYSMAYRQAELPYHAIADPVGTVTFPAFARMRHEAKDVGPAYLTALRLVCLLTCPLGIIMSAGAAPFVVVLFGPHWLPMIAPLTVLGLWAIARPLQVTIGRLLNSLEKAWLYGRISTIGLVPLGIAAATAASLGGITAVGAVLLAYMTILTVLLVRVVARHAGVPVRAQWGVLWPMLLASAISWVATRATADAIHDAAPVVWLGASVAACLLTYCAALAVADRDVLSLALRQARRILPARRVAVTAQ